MAGRRCAAGLSSTLQGASVPHGFTLTIWSAGQALSPERGSPHVALAFLFVAGAALAFALLRWLVREARPEVDPGGGNARPHLLAAVAVQIASIGAAIGAATLVGQIPSGIDWPAGGFLATAAYMTGTAAGVTLHAG